MRRLLLVLATFCIASRPSVSKGADASDTWVYQSHTYGNFQIGKTTLTLKTKWRENKMHYVFTLSPVDQLKINGLSYIQRTSGGFHVLMRDEDGFNMIDIFLPLSSFMSVKDEASDIVTGLEANSSVECSLSKYKTLKSWIYSYNYDVFVDDSESQDVGQSGSDSSSNNPSDKSN